jgi:hypothetical protein
VSFEFRYVKNVVCQYQGTLLSGGKYDWKVRQSMLTVLKNSIDVIGIKDVIS